MSHRIYTGSFAALEMRLMQEVEARQKDNPLAPVIVLVGSNLLASYLRRRFAEEHRAAANIRCLTFLDLVIHLAGGKGCIDAKPRLPRLPRLGPSAILESIIAAQTPPVFKEVSGYLGFRNALLDTFRDLRDAGIGASRLDDSMRHWIGTLPDRRDHLLGLAQLYRRFREKVGLFRDVDDDFREAIRNSAEAGKLFGVQSLLVYGVYDATGQQAQLLASLKSGLEMVFFIPFVNEAVSRFALPFLKSRAEDLKVKHQSLAPSVPAGSLGSLWSADFGLRDRTIVTPEGSAGTRLGADGAFALVSAPGESRVALEVARELLRAARDGVIAGFHEAAVILRQAQEELPLLIEVFRLRGIPFFVHGGTSLAERPLSKAVLALCSLAASSFSRQSILTAMELIGAALPAEASSKWDVTRWRALTNDPRFLSGVDSWDASTRALVIEARRDLSAAAAPAMSAENEEEEGMRILSEPVMREKLGVAEALESGWQILRGAVAEWPAASSWRGWAESVEKKFSSILGASEDWPPFAAIIDELRNLDLVCGTAGLEAQVPLARFVEALKESLAGFAHPAGSFQRSGVNLLTTGAARGLRFPLVIIPGLEEGKFPARLRQDPLLLDSERTRIGPLPLKSQRGEEEKLLFDMAARSAEKRLVLITSRLDESSEREHIPSQFFMDFAGAVCGKAVSLSDLNEEVVPGFRSVSLDNPAPREGDVPIDESEIRIRAICSDAGSKLAMLAALAADDAKFLAGPLAYDRARFARRLTAYDGRLQNNDLVRWAAEKSLALAGQISASRVEQYAKCPYQFYLKRVMDIERWEEEGSIEIMDPLAKGSVIHSILEKYLKEISAEKLLRSPLNELQERLESKARAILERERPVGLPDLLWEIERDRIMQTLQTWLAFEKGRMGENILPAFLERPFGAFSLQEVTPPLHLRAGKYQFDFRGRIDRIDLSRDGKQARVIDYKTGKVPASLKGKGRTPLMAGERIQIAIYRGALASMADLNKLESIDGEYLHLASGEENSVPIVFTNDELIEAGQRLPQILEVLADGIMEGVFFARTSGTVRPEGHCKFCDFLPICGKDRQQREGRKISDPAVLRFLQVQAIDGMAVSGEE